MNTNWKNKNLPLILLKLEHMWADAGIVKNCILSYIESSWIFILLCKVTSSIGKTIIHLYMIHCWNRTLRLQNLDSNTLIPTNGYNRFKTSFNSKYYGDSRPNYPQSFYDTLISYDAKARRELGVYIGRGSGSIACKLADYFKKWWEQIRQKWFRQCNLK